MSERTQRRLAAVVSADVVGYSRLMGRDEDSTLAALRGHRASLIDPLIAQHGGRIVKTMGDGLLLEFPSVVDATQCVIEIQQGMVERNVGIDEDRRIIFRIGVNLGDIIVEGEDILGDGVNIAARLQGIAEPGGVSISRRVHEDVRDRLDAQFEDGGEQKLKNIARPISVWRWLPDASPGAISTTADAPLPLPNKSSIAVLPFENMSGDPEQRYFSDGITEDIITELSRFSSLLVVARNSTFVYRDQAVDVGEIGKKLGVEYLLEGSLRKAGNRIRLTAQLINVQTGMHVWANRYDRDLEDIFAIQDELVHAIVSTLAIRLTAADTERTMRKPAESHAAYDLYLRSLALDSQYDPESAREGRKLAEQAVALDPGFARAHALLAGQIFTCGWFEGGDVEIYTKDALQAAMKAVDLDPDDSFCTALLGAVYLQHRDYEQARHYLEMALTSNPHDTWVWADYAWYLMSVGKPREALYRLDRKEIFEPYPPNWHWEIRGQILYQLERFEEAVAALERMSVTPYWVHGFLAACYGQLGNSEKARDHWTKAMEASPHKNAHFFIEIAQYKHEADANRWLEGLCKAGIEA